MTAATLTSRTAPLITDREITAQIPGLSIRPGDHQPHVRGKIREYLPLW